MLLFLQTVFKHQYGYGYEFIWAMKRTTLIMKIKRSRSGYNVTFPNDYDEIDDDEVKTLMVVMTPSLARGKRALLSPAWELPP